MDFVELAKYGPVGISIALVLVVYLIVKHNSTERTESQKIFAGIAGEFNKTLANHLQHALEAEKQTAVALQKMANVVSNIRVFAEKRGQ